MFSFEIINYFTIAIALTIFCLFNLNNNRIANYFDLIDKPKNNKIHKHDTPLTAGFPVIFTLDLSRIT